MNEKPNKLIAEVNYSADCLLLHRAEHKQLKTSPFYAIIDEGRLEEAPSLLL